MLDVSAPALARRPQPGSLLRKLAVGVDGSPASHAALRWAARLAVDSAATVVAIHVLTFSHELTRDFTLDTMRTWRRELRRDLETTWIEPLRSEGIEHRCLLVEADTIAGGLLEAAGKTGADLLVVGSGRSGVADRLFGSTYRLTHDSRLPAVIIPPAWDATAPPAPVQVAAEGP